MTQGPADGRIPIQLGHLGYDVERGRIVAWLRSVGDVVARGEALVEVETDKVTIAQEAPRTGRLTEIVHREGDEVEVGTIIGFLVEA